MSSIQNRSGQGFSDGLLNDYFIDDCIGHGSFATVYRAYHKTTNKAAAIKVILSSRLNDKLLKSIEFEIKVLRDLKHPNITELYDIKRLPTKVCLIMELCSFGDLSEYIKKNRLQPGTGGPAGGLSEVIFRHFLQQLVSAFKFLREKNLVHRDLKPQNILLSLPEEIEQGKQILNYTDSLPQLKVADFGFAKILPAQTLTETACGSPLYMAPEILQRKAYDASADLWSIGAVLYEMATGQPPFSAQTHTELVNRIKAGRDRIWFPGDPIDYNYFPQIPEKIPTLSQYPPGQALVSEDIKDLLRGLLKQVPSSRITFEDFFSHSAIRNFEAPPRPAPSVYKSKPTSSSSEKSKPSSLDKQPEDNIYGNQDSTSLKEKVTFSRNSPNPRKLSAHQRSHSASLPSKPAITRLSPGEHLDDECLDKEYIMIDSIFDNARSTSRKENKFQTLPRSSINTTDNQNILYKVKSNISRTRYDKSDKTSIEDNFSQEKLSSLEKNSPTFPRHPGSISGHSQISESGWKVGENATSVLTNAISRASSKLFGSHGISPPSEQYRADSTNPNTFSLERTFANSKEDILQDIELIACQAYALTKFADFKIDLVYNKITFESNPDTNNDDDEASPSKNHSESFFVYTKALALLRQAYKMISRYWTEVSMNRSNLTVSIRLSKAVRWLQDKTKECLDKAESILSKTPINSLDSNSFCVDQSLYNHALSSCQEGVFKEIKGEKIQECEMDYMIGLWSLQAILFRIPQESPLSDTDSSKLRLVISLVEERLMNFRKALDELGINHSSARHPMIPSFSDSRI